MKRYITLLILSALLLSADLLSYKNIYFGADRSILANEQNSFGSASNAPPSEHHRIKNATSFKLGYKLGFIRFEFGRYFVKDKHKEDIAISSFAVGLTADALSLKNLSDINLDIFPSIEAGLTDRNLNAAFNIHYAINKNIELMLSERYIGKNALMIGGGTTSVYGTFLGVRFHFE